MPSADQAALLKTFDDIVALSEELAEHHRARGESRYATSTFNAMLRTPTLPWSQLATRP